MVSQVRRNGPYHEGELAVQERAGAGDMARRIVRGLRAEIPPGADAFLRKRRFAVLGWPEAAPGDGASAPRMWASPLFGEPGFLAGVAPRALSVRADMAAGDPIEGSGFPGDGVDVGMVAIDLATRRRLRVNGVARGQGPGAFDIETRQVYGNCPKYIQARELVPRRGTPAGEPASSSRLDESQARWVAAADTFFIATRHPEAGADASHRGGRPGFVRVADGGRALWWPDYPGNTMYQTMGNLAVDGSAGLLFIDFDSGSTLQLAGSARIEWEPERRIELRIERVVEIPHALPLRWRFIDPSPYNP
jgi:predicted pyridoxine 5'-phosphate oxidase superfamily flavin-nucleotide-binding protein